MTLLETLPGVHRWCCTWCGREADRDEPCCEERMPAYEAAARSLWPAVRPGEVACPDPEGACDR